MINRRIFLRNAATASAVVASGSLGSSASLPTLSAGSLAAIAAWQTAQGAQNAIWNRYCATQDRSIYDGEWRPAYETAQDALTAMLIALHAEGIAS